MARVKSFGAATADNSLVLSGNGDGSVTVWSNIDGKPSYVGLYRREELLKALGVPTKPPELSPLARAEAALVELLASPDDYVRLSAANQLRTA